MKSKVVTLIMVVLLMGASAALAKPKHHHGAVPSTASSSPATAPGAPAVNSGAAINQYCAVEKENPVDSKVFTIYEGQKIGFCCKDCIEKFNASPAQYMAGLK